MFGASPRFSLGGVTLKRPSQKKKVPGGRSVERLTMAAEVL